MEKKYRFSPPVISAYQFMQYDSLNTNNIIGSSYESDGEKYTDDGEEPKTGSLGSVRRFTTKDRTRSRAVKKLQYEGSVDFTDQDFDVLRDEAKFATIVYGKENVSFFKDPNTMRHRLVVPYFEGDHFIKAIENNPKDFYLILRSIFEALQSLHNQNIIHGDIQKNNLILLKGDEKYTATFIDFGFSYMLEGGITTCTSAKCAYFAPERTQIPHNGSAPEPNVKQDYYSLLAMVLFGYENSDTLREIIKSDIDLMNILSCMFDEENELIDSSSDLPDDILGQLISHCNKKINLVIRLKISELFQSAVSLDDANSYKQQLINKLKESFDKNSASYDDNKLLKTFLQFVRIISHHTHPFKNRTISDPTKTQSYIELSEKIDRIKYLLGETLSDNMWNDILKAKGSSLGKYGVFTFKDMLNESQENEFSLAVG